MRLRRSFSAFLNALLLLLLLGPSAIALGGSPVPEARVLPTHRTVQHGHASRFEVPATQDKPLHHATVKFTDFDFANMLALDMGQHVEQEHGKSPLELDEEVLKTATQAVLSILILATDVSEDDEPGKTMALLPEEGLLMMSQPDGKLSHVIPVQNLDRASLEGNPALGEQLGNIPHALFASKGMAKFVRLERNELFLHLRDGRRLPLKVPSIVELEADLRPGTAESP